MQNTSSNLYKRAFSEYLRYGAAIDLSQKSDNQSTTHYIWRTRGDGKVRSSHQANDGKIFAWNNPPPTGHPGEDYGCRCIAEPYNPEVDEYMTMVMIGISDASPAWKDGLGGDFQDHYRQGDGSPVRLRDTGHLKRVVDEYWRQVEERLLGQIADVARKKAGKSFTYDFDNVYEMRPIVFDLGETTIGGIVTGQSSVNKLVALRFEGTCNFYLRDKFEDPFNIGIELPSSKIYDIYDDWKGRVRGLVYLDRNLSEYRFDG